MNTFRRLWQSFGTAFLLILVAAAMRLWPLQALEGRVPWLTFYPAVMIIALYRGLTAGLLGVVLSCVTVLFLLPLCIHQPLIKDFADYLAMAVFFATGIIISYLSEAMHRARARERQVEAEYDRLFTLSLDLLCVAKSDGFFKRLNPAFTQTLGWSVDEMLRRPFLEFVHPDDREATLREVDRQVVAGEKVILFINRYQHKDGSWRWLSWKSVPQPGGMMYASARDITDLKQMEETIRESEHRLRALNEELDERVRKRTTELVNANKELQDEIVRRTRAEELLGNLNVELEQRVRERTLALVASNKELEAFSYSVSHDLRAPLRSIDGFSQVVLDEYGPKLDAKGQGYLKIVRTGCQQMGNLIEALLELSRVTRTPMRHEPVNFTTLAQGIATELQRHAPERVVQFHIANGLSAVGDPRLLEAVLMNLIENAWKFTTKRPEAVIELGVTETQVATPLVSTPVYFVRDNGAGFDMAYSNKLFSPFQRLHTLKEFPGTGIGLATVQRILLRHGGRIWSEAAVDKGATFYFTVPSNDQTGRPSAFC